MLRDFNIIATCSRGTENKMCSELRYLLNELGAPSPLVGKTGISGLIVAKTLLDPFKAINKFRVLFRERPYEFRYTQRIIPIEKTVPTDLEEIIFSAKELSSRIEEDESFRITVEKRFTSIHSSDVIEGIAAEIQKKVDLENPDKILLIEIIGELTGIALIKPNEILSVRKEKML
ncbi:THUMP domain-containing protein [Candidatus Bathyarchaeota archaeon]|nr:THUMP domain-containing protein [Candidatus Bathyarchaeota archaeon]